MSAQAIAVLDGGMAEPCSDVSADGDAHISTYFGLRPVESEPALCAGVPVCGMPSRSSPSAEMSGERVSALLRECEVLSLNRLPSSSNQAFLADLVLDGLDVQAVYKPVWGERPLWDFPPGLARREYSAYLLDEVLGWHLVPPTVLRYDLPFGVGSLQLFVSVHLEQNYFTMLAEQHLRPHLERICAFDVVINNADRKAGHCLLGFDNSVWAIDNGLSFHNDSKLRTVMWDFAGEDMPAGILEDLQRLSDVGLPGPLEEVLDPFESEAVLERTRFLLGSGHFPVNMRGGLDWPWPLV